MARPTYTVEPCCDGRRVAILYDGVTVRTVATIEEARAYVELKRLADQPVDPRSLERAVR